MTLAPVLTGPEAIARLTVDYPGARHFFGDHPTMEGWLAVLTHPKWTVLESGGCFVFGRDWGDGLFEAHWFCPNGADLPALRSMALWLFENRCDTILGDTPKGHQNERAARVLARAIGMERKGDLFWLPRERFMCYNAKYLQGITPWVSRPSLAV